MLIIFAAAIIMLGARCAPRGSFYDDSFSQTQTRALKGIFAILVMLHHLCTYLADSFASLFIFKHVGYLMVGGFFLISGYGLTYGVKNKQNYLKGFFRSRILTILIPYYIINLGYLFLNYFLINNPEGFKKYVIRSIFGLHLWYVPVMIVLYAAFFLCFKIFKEKHGHIAITVFVAAFVTMFFASYKCGILPSYGRWWYNSTMCFALGVWYSKYKERINELIKRRYTLTASASIILFFILFAAATKCYSYDSALTLGLEMLCATLFCASVIILSLKIKIGNKLINICGDLSFELYLSHALFISIFRWGRPISIPFLNIDYYLYVSNPDPYLCSILIASFIFSTCVHRIAKLISKPIIKKK